MSASPEVVALILRRKPHHDQCIQCEDVILMIYWEVGLNCCCPDSRHHAGRDGWEGTASGRVSEGRGNRRPGSLVT